MEEEPKSKDDNDGSLKKQVTLSQFFEKNHGRFAKKGNKRQTFRQIEGEKILNRMYLILINLLLLAQKSPKVKH